MGSLKSILTPNQFRQEFLLEFLDTDPVLLTERSGGTCDDIVPLFERDGGRARGATVTVDYFTASTSAVAD